MSTLTIRLPDDTAARLKTLTPHNRRDVVAIDGLVIVNPWSGA